jgi:hypothetical protein
MSTKWLLPSLCSPELLLHSELLIYAYKYIYIYINKSCLLAVTSALIINRPIYWTYSPFTAETE